MNNIEDNLESNEIIYAKAVELASLVGTYLWKVNYKKLLANDFKNKRALKKWLKQLQENSSDNIAIVLDGSEQNMTETEIKAKLEEISAKIFNIINDFHNLIKADGALELETEENWLDEMNLEALVDENFTYNVIDRIRELYAQNKVRAYYEAELVNREDDFLILKNGYTHLKEVKKIDKLIEKAKNKILDIRIQAFKERRQTNPKEIALINKIKEHIRLKIAERDKILAYREIATVYRLEEIKKYRKQLETSWYIRTPSLEKLIEKTIDYVLLGKNVLLTWPTGTGKTVLAIEVVKTIAKKLNMQISQISGKKLWEELKEKKSLKKLDDFVEVLSWHAGITPSEFISKIKLETDGKWGTKTVSELGKILKAFVNGSIPIIDEIDLIPNDVLMRIKHLFTLKAGQSYAPQEDGNNRHTLISTSVIAIANIKSEKHPDREDLDPAIIRLFKGVEVGYLPNHEIYDIAITSIVQKEGFIYGTGIESLSDNQQGILYLLIAALKNIESNYLGIGDGESISNKAKQFLRKAVLELGNFIWLFVWFKESGKEFNKFIKEQILEFVSNHAYPKNDRLILIKIFSSKGLITKSDIPFLVNIMSDIGEEELDQSIISESFSFKKDILNFVDPYQIANMDPYWIRNLEILELKYKPSDINNYLKELDSFLMENDIENSEKLEDFIQNFFDKVEKDINYDLDNRKKQQELLALLYDLELVDWILKLEEEYPEFEDNIKILKMLDMTKGKKLFGDLNKKEDKEKKIDSLLDYMKRLEKSILDGNIEGNEDTIENLKSYINEFYKKEKEAQDYKMDKQEQMKFLDLLYQAELTDRILELEENYPEFQEKIELLKILDWNSKNWKKLFIWNPFWLSPEITKDHDKWTDKLDIDKLGKWLRFRSKYDNDIIWKIIEVKKESEELIISVRNEEGKIETITVNFPKFYSIYSVLIQDLLDLEKNESKERWTTNYDENDLKEWLKVKCPGYPGEIGEITSIRNNSILIERDSIIHGIWIEEFKENHSILKKEIEEEIEDDKYWTDDFETEDLHEWTKVKLDEKEGKILSVGVKNIEIERDNVIHGIWIEEFKEKHFIIKNKRGNNFENNKFRTDDFEIKDLHELMTVKQGGEEGHIHYIDSEEETIDIIREANISTLYTFKAFKDYVEILKDIEYYKQAERSSVRKLDDLKKDEERKVKKGERVATLWWVNSNGKIKINWDDNDDLELYDFEEFKKIFKIDIREKIEKIEDLEVGMTIKNKDTNLLYTVKWFLWDGVSNPSVIVENELSGNQETVDWDSFKKYWKAIKKIG